MLTQVQVREMFDYNPETGEVIRKITVGWNAKAGDLAGGLNTDGYMQVEIASKKYLLHRIIWLWVTGRWPEPEVDHENHIHGDNRWENLRETSHLENGRNQSLRKDSMTGFPGVGRDKRRNKWRAKIQHEGQRKHLGYFDKKEDAVAARKAAEGKYGFHENHGKAVVA